MVKIIGKISIPVLMYHHVNLEGASINVTPQVFEAHMRYLKEHNFNTLHIGEFLSILAGKKRLSKRSVMITFDDGWLDNWVFAFPVLKKYGLKAVIFVITSLMAERGRRQRADEETPLRLPPHRECEKMIKAGRGSEVMVSWEEIKEMETSGLIDIQSHTHTHSRWDILFNDYKARMDSLYKDLKLSKVVIEERLSKQCIALCWPWGRYDDGYIELARSLGYELLFTTEKGANTPITEPWRVRRIVIGNITPLKFRKKLFIHSRDWLSKTYLKVFK